MTARARFTQGDVTRALKAAISAGYEAPRLIIHPDGTIELICAREDPEPDDDEWADLR